MIFWGECLISDHAIKDGVLVLSPAPKHERLGNLLGYVGLLDGDLCDERLRELAVRRPRWPRYA